MYSCFLWNCWLIIHTWLCAMCRLNSLPRSLMLLQKRARLLATPEGISFIACVTIYFFFPSTFYIRCMYMDKWNKNAPRHELFTCHLSNYIVWFHPAFQVNSYEEEDKQTTKPRITMDCWFFCYMCIFGILRDGWALQKMQKVSYVEITEGVYIWMSVAVAERG